MSNCEHQWEQSPQASTNSTLVYRCTSCRAWGWRGLRKNSGLTYLTDMKVYNGPRYIDNPHDFNDYFGANDSYKGRTADMNPAPITTPEVDRVFLGKRKIP